MRVDVILLQGGPLKSPKEGGKGRGGMSYYEQLTKPGKETGLTGRPETVAMQLQAQRMGSGEFHRLLYQHSIPRNQND